MRRVRRTSPELRLEMTPLIDVIFLLLTFFIFSIVMMVRAEHVRIEVPAVGEGQPGEPGETLTISITREGRCFVGDRETPLESLAARVSERLAQDPTAPVAIAADEGADWGRVMAVIERVRAQGVSALNLVGVPAEAAP